jgi:hypothetical protein
VSGTSNRFFDAGIAFDDHLVLDKLKITLDNARKEAESGVTFDVSHHRDVRQLS